jgi:BolA family transcriptional regulator, general stress-responsive regulator
VNTRTDMIRQQLSALEPQQLEIEDQSHLHAGHVGARAGGGHFAVLIVSQHFSGKSLLERHRMVYRALQSAMQTEIHALSIKAYAPGELSNLH